MIDFNEISEKMDDFLRSQGLDPDDLANKASKHFTGDKPQRMQRDLTQEELEALVTDEQNYNDQV